MLKLIQGDCLKKLKDLEDCSVDSVVTDPPYGISFLGNKWDYDVPSVEVWKECLRVLKPGGHLLAFSGTRTQHRMAVRIEDAGFEIRDMIAWVYGSGFPKSHNISKAIDKKMGAEPEIAKEGKDIFGSEITKTKTSGISGSFGDGEWKSEKPISLEITEATSPEAKIWKGWGTAIKPALEPITMAKKKIKEKNTADNVLKYGTGGLNIDGSRVGERFPANLIHDGGDQVLQVLPGESARFFYCPKTSKKERDQGLEGFEKKQYSHDGRIKSIENPYQRNKSKSKNNHPTVKPIALMEYLVKLVTPPGGIVLDPYMGSGTTGVACRRNGFGFVGIELDRQYYDICQARIEYENKNKEDQGGLFGDV